MKFEFNPAITKKEMVKGVVELYCYYFRKCREASKKYEDHLQYMGAHDAIGAVALQVLGDKQLYKLWEELVKEDPEGDNPSAPSI